MSKIDYTSIFGKPAEEIGSILKDLQMFFDKDIFETSGPVPPTPSKPANNEIWYTTSDGQPYDLQGLIDFMIEQAPLTISYIGPKIISNEFDGEKWIITFDSDVTDTGVREGSNRTVLMYPFFMGANPITQKLYNITSIILPDSVNRIHTSSIFMFIALTDVSLPASLMNIEHTAIMECPTLKDVTYRGTKEQWNKISKDEEWFDEDNAPIDTIHCTDGDIVLGNLVNIMIDDEYYELYDGVTYAEQGYTNLYTQYYYLPDESPDDYSYDTSTNYPQEGDILYSYCDEYTDIIITINDNPTTVRTDRTYAQLGYDMLYTQNYYSVGESADDYKINTNNTYPHEGDEYWTYCNKDASIVVSINDNNVILYSNKSYISNGYEILYTQNHYPVGESANNYRINTYNTYPHEGDEYWTYCNEEQEITIMINGEPTTVRKDLSYAENNYNNLWSQHVYVAEIGETTNTYKINTETTQPQVDDICWTYCNEVESFDSVVLTFSDGTQSRLSNKTVITETDMNSLYSGHNRELDLIGVTLSNYVIKIGQYSFHFCYNVDQIEIPSSVLSIKYAFFGVKNIVYNGSATEGSPWGAGAVNGYIENGLLYNDSNKTRLCGCMRNTVNAIIPEGVTSLDDISFFYRENLESVYVPSSLQQFSKWVNYFIHCNKLTTIVVDQNNTKYDSRDNCNAIIETATNKLIEGCKDTIIPNSVTTIGQYSFRARETMTTMTIPSSVTSIEQSAFTECTGLTSIICLATVPPSLGSYAMNGSYPIYVPAESVERYKTTSGWSGYSSRIQAIPELVS